MGPRLISRGVREVDYESVRTCLLQWGRGSLAAAWIAVRLRTGYAKVLQWGRGSLAAAWQGSQVREVARERLQWGRGSLAAACTHAIIALVGGW